MLWLFIVVTVSLLIRIPAPKPHERLKDKHRFLIALAMYTACLFVGTVAFSFRTDVPEAMDFRQLYSGGFLARTDPGELYSLDAQKQVQSSYVAKTQTTVLPFNHSAYEALLLAPLSKLPYRQAYLCFLILNSLLLIPCFLLCEDVFSGPPTFGRPMAGWFFSFWPTSEALVQGQDSVLLFLCICLTYRVIKSGKLYLAGISLSLALFKPHLMLLLACFLTARYGWRFLAGSLTGSVALSMVSVAVTGLSGLKAFFGLLLATGGGESSAKSGQGDLGIHPALMPNLRGLVFDIFANVASREVVFAISIGMSAGLIVWALWLLRKPLSQPLTFSLAIVCAVLASYHVYIHDLIFLLLPLGLLVGRVIPPQSKLITVLYLLPIASKVAGGPLMSLVALPVLWLLYCIKKALPANTASLDVICVEA